MTTAFRVTWGKRVKFVFVLLLLCRNLKVPEEKHRAVNTDILLSFSYRCYTARSISDALAKNCHVGD